eukprot:TRINITY_DN2042_c0_g1_i4.p2 TRINITY_DN2042_c0_g1~~TRINITY_DN2042_c0_g1_i4.p2  ORF type:complete len:380 (+),score=97.26 TRINITY_DN2042_c0_g1_i4:197-1336(+)
MAAAAPSAASSAVRGSRLFNVGRRGAVLPLGRAPRAAAAGSLASSARVDRRRLLGLASGAAAGAGYQRAPRPGLSVGPVGLADAASSTPPAAFAAAPARRRLSSTDGPTFPPPKEVIPGPATALSEEEALLQDMVAKFAARHVAPLVASMDVNAELDATLLTQLFEAGLMGVEVPAVHGGGGMSFTSSIIVIEELAKVDAAVSAVVDIHNTLLCNAVRRHGDEAQQAEWLPRLATTSLGAFCLSEAGSGSDAFALKTTAVRDGGGWVLNGTKAWISNAKEADIFLVFANADPAAGHRGITAFLVDRAAAATASSLAKRRISLASAPAPAVSCPSTACGCPPPTCSGQSGRGTKSPLGGSTRAASALARSWSASRRAPWT